MNSISKSQLRVQDRISGLPDELLWHILSLLDTRDAVRTCILSTRWKNIWAYVPTLDFDRICFPDSDKFLAFVDHVLLFRHSSNIKKFRILLRGLDVDHSRINAWINNAITCNVVELEIDVGFTCQFKIFELPKSLIMSKTLVSLRLTSEFTTSIPASGCFPSLKSLHVTFYYNFAESMFDVLSNCPILEDFTMIGILRYGDSSNFNIASPALKTLKICFTTHGDFYGSSDSFSYITINCPQLENLDVIEEVSSTYYWGEAKSLVKASICLSQHCSHEPCFYNVTALLAGVSNVTDLYIFAHTFHSDYFFIFTKVGALPVFKNLRRLKLVRLECFSWDLLTTLLIISPILECLVLERKASGMGCEHEDGSDDGEYSDYTNGSGDGEDSESEEASEHEYVSDQEEGIDNEHQLDLPDFVPNCCLLHLKYVFFLGFMGEHDELEMVKYLLKHAQVLNKMTISMDDLSVCRKEKVCKEILMVPRGSRSSVVEFF